MTIQHVVTGAGAPTAAPPSLSAHYINTATGEQYLAKGTTSVEDWVLQQSGMLKSEADQTYQPVGDYATQQQLSEGLANKVTAEVGKGLSDENYTAAEKSKLAGLEGSHYRGTFLSISALQTAFPSGAAGDYADVDAGAGSDVARYVWDATDGAWIAMKSSAEPLTAAQVKSLYESNPDTNAFSDAEKTKLAGLSSDPVGGGGAVGADAVVIEADASITAAHAGKKLLVGPFMQLGNDDYSSTPISLTLLEQAASEWPVGAEVELIQRHSSPIVLQKNGAAAILYDGTHQMKTRNAGDRIKLTRLKQDSWVMRGDLVPFSEDPYLSGNWLDRTTLYTTTGDANIWEENANFYMQALADLYYQARIRAKYPFIANAKFQYVEVIARSAGAEFGLEVRPANTRMNKFSYTPPMRMVVLSNKVVLYRGTTNVAELPAIAENDTIGIGYIDNELYVNVNGAWVGGCDVATRVPFYTASAGTVLYPVFSVEKGTMSVGFKTWNWYNWPSTGGINVYQVAGPDWVDPDN